MNAFLAIILVLVSLASTAKAFGIQNKGSILSDMADMQISIEGESKEEQKTKLQKQKLKDPKLTDSLPQEEDPGRPPQEEEDPSLHCRADVKLNMACNWAETIKDMQMTPDITPYVVGIAALCVSPDAPSLDCGYFFARPRANEMLGTACRNAETIKDKLKHFYDPQKPWRIFPWATELYRQVDLNMIGPLCNDVVSG